MAQRVRLDHPGMRTYLALVLLGGCQPSLAPIIPKEWTPVAADSVAVWSGATAPAGRTLHRFKWLYHDERSSVGGRGSARIAGPDSLRFDVAGPLGANPAAAMVVGDSAVWIDAPESIKDIVPSYPLLWAGFGVVRLPEGATVVSAGVAGTTAVWRMVTDQDTVDFALTRGSDRRLQAEVRRAGTTLARMDARFGPDGAPTRAQLTI